MFALPAERLSVWQVFSVSFKIWEQGFFKMLPLVLACTIIAALPHFFIPELNTYYVRLTYALIEQHKIFLSFYTFFTFIVFATILYEVKTITVDGKSDIWMALLVGIKKLPYTFIASLVLAICIYGGLSLFIIPGILASILLAFYVPLIIIDNENPFTAFKHSCQLVWDYWWRTFLIFGLPTFTYWIVAYGIEMTTVNHLIIKTAQGEIWFLHNALRVLLNVIYLPWFCALILVELRDLKFRKGELPEIKTATLINAA